MRGPHAANQERDQGADRGTRAVKGQKRARLSIHGFEGGSPLPGGPDAAYRRIPSAGGSGRRTRRRGRWSISARCQKAIDDKKLDAQPIDAAAMPAADCSSIRATDAVRASWQRRRSKTKTNEGPRGPSASAIAAVEKAGGKVELPTQDRGRGGLKPDGVGGGVWPHLCRCNHE